MEKIKYTLLLLFCVFFAPKMRAQNPSYIRAGLVKTQLTFSPSYMFSDQQSYFYLHGSWEAYLSTKLSLAGEGYAFLGKGPSESKTLDHNHNVFWGTSWHFTKNNNDFYLGLQPGITLSRINKTEYNLPKTHLGVNPVFSTVMGYNFFVYKFFHFFVQSRLLLAEHNQDVHKNLSEIRFSGGLGFNLNFLKAK